MPYIPVTEYICILILNSLKENKDFNILGDNIKMDGALCLNEATRP